MISSMARRWPAIAKAQKLRNRRDFCWRSLFSRKHKKQLLKASVGSGKQRKKLSPTTTHSFRWLNLADRSQPPKLYHWCPLHLGMKPTKVQALAWTIKKFSFFPLTFFPTLLFCSLRESIHYNIIYHPCNTLLDRYWRSTNSWPLSGTDSGQLWIALA